MEPMLLKLFVSSIREQCFAGLVAHDGVMLGLKASRASGVVAGVRADDVIWMSLHTLLNAAANVSKHLFPSDRREAARRFPERGRLLRELLGVEEDSPLTRRTLRNHLEHFDERLEAWWLADQNHNIVRRIIGPFGFISVGGLADESTFEHFDPESMVLAFWGDRYELAPVVAEMRRLFELSRALDDVPEWAPPFTPATTDSGESTDT